MTTSHYSSGLERTLHVQQQYLESSVRTASPARLRLMLIERAVDVAGSLAAKWRAKNSLGVNEHSLKLLDLLTELLGGVKRGGNEAEQLVCRQVADLYVFLTQHLVEAELNSDASSIDEIRVVLETEAETWRSVCAQEGARQPSALGEFLKPSGRLDLEG